MESLDSDEAIFALVAFAVAVAWAVQFVWRLVSVPALRPRIGRRLLLAAVSLVCFGPTVVVLNFWADGEVRGNGAYWFLFLSGQGLCLGVGQWVCRLLGVDMAKDVLDDGNAAALLTFVGWLCAVSLVYAASNIGNGPTIWTTLVPAGCGLLCLAGCWLLLNALARGTLDAIVIDRDLATGGRVAAMLVACAVIIGRAAAGRFASWDGTFHDLALFSSPAILIVVLAGIAQIKLMPTPQRPRPSPLLAGALPAAGFLLLGALVVIFRDSPLDPSKW